MSISALIRTPDGEEKDIELVPGDGLYNLFRKPGVRRYTTSRFGVKVVIERKERRSDGAV